MTADEIKALVERLRQHSETGSCMEGTMTMAERAADALEAANARISDLLTQLEQKELARYTLATGYESASKRAADLEAQLTAKTELATLYAASLRKAEAEVEDLKHDNASMLDSLTKESTARCEAEDLIATLTASLQGLSDMYGSAWDLVDGGLVMMSGSIPRFEAAHLAAREAIDAARSQSEEKKP